MTTVPPCSTISTKKRKRVPPKILGHETNSCHRPGATRRDIAKILRRSGANFGNQGRDRYRRLIDQAMQDPGDDPARVGVQSIDEIREGYFLYHLKWGRKVSAGSPVRQPRHLIVFFIDDSDDIIVARIFHEQQMLSRHLAGPDDN